MRALYRPILGGLLLPALVGGVPGRVPAPGGAQEPAIVQGVTISCQGWGSEWGTPGFGRELDDLGGLGVNWVAIHPYARVHADGRLTWRAIDPEAPPNWLCNPVEEARRRGMSILIKPHLAYWGSPFSWRGEIDFAEPEALARFFRDYREWITLVARATRGADAFCVGTELDRLVVHEAPWREVIAAVRGATGAHLTYAANWTDFERVPFWDALDAVGVQAYFPIAEDPAPDDAELARGWERVVARLRSVHERTGKPVIFTEFGYNRSLEAARRPWAYEVARGPEAAPAEALQLRCLAAGLSVLERERDWLRGAFLWKWFVGEPGWHDGNFRLNTPAVRGVIQRYWGASSTQGD